MFALFRASIVALCLSIGLGPAFAGSMMLMGVGGASGGAPAGPTYALAGSDSTSGSAAVFTSTTIDLGAATSDRYVIVAASDQNGVAISSVTVNGVAINQDCFNNGSSNASRIFSGLVGTSGGAGLGTIVLNYSGAAGFTARAISVFVGRGMSNTISAVSTNSTPSAAFSLSMSVTAADFLVAVSTFNSTFLGSTQVPTGTVSVPIAPISQSAPYWNTIISTNAAFNVASSVATTYCAANYH